MKNPDAESPELESQAVTELEQAIGREGVSEVLSTFRDDLRDRYCEATDSLQRLDCQGFAAAVHSLKSSVQYVGGRSFALLCAELEAAALGGDIGAVEARRPVFEKRLQQIEVELASLSEQLKA